MSDIEREKFEAWFSTTPNFRMINDLLRNTFEKSESGNYVVSTVDDLWKAWQAASHDVCEWSEDDDGIFQTSCGESFEVTEGTPEENNFKFCCYCGGDLKQKLFEREGFLDD